MLRQERRRVLVVSLGVSFLVLILNVLSHTSVVRVRYTTHTHGPETFPSKVVITPTSPTPPPPSNTSTPTPPNSTWTSPLVSPEEGVCEPRYNLMFIKTHKCASSTTQRIFLRYGKVHKLTQVLPATGNYLGSPLPFKTLMVPRFLRTPDNTYNMLVLHTRLDTYTVPKVMKPGAAWVTIVREPVALFESLWSFFKLEQFYKMTLDQFADMPYTDVVRWRSMKVFGIHQMFFDLGYGSIEDFQPGDMDRIISRLNSSFDLVMVAERYDESLVLLKNLMCWTTQDVTYLKINYRKEHLKKNLSEETVRKLRQMNKPDVQIYNFFYKLFEQKVEAFGRERMAKEVAELKEANERLKKECLVEETSPERANEDMDWINLVERQSVHQDNEACVDLAKTELSFIDDVRKQQWVWAKDGWKHYTFLGGHQLDRQQEPLNKQQWT